MYRVINFYQKNKMSEAQLGVGYELKKCCEKKVFVIYNVVRMKCSWSQCLYLNKVSINSEAIQGKSSGFITAEYIHASHFFNCCHPFCNGTLIT